MERSRAPAGDRPPPRPIRPSSSPARPETRTAPGAGRGACGGTGAPASAPLGGLRVTDRRLRAPPDRDWRLPPDAWGARGRGQAVRAGGAGPRAECESGARRREVRAASRPRRSTGPRRRPAMARPGPTCAGGRPMATLAGKIYAEAGCSPCRRGFPALTQAPRRPEVRDAGRLHHSRRPARALADGQGPIHALRGLRCERSASMAPTAYRLRHRSQLRREGGQSAQQDEQRRLAMIEPRHGKR